MKLVHAIVKRDNLLGVTGGTSDEDHSEQNAVLKTSCWYPLQPSLLCKISTAKSTVTTPKSVLYLVSRIELFSNERRKPKIKVITLTNHNKHKLPNEPIRTRSKYM